MIFDSSPTALKSKRSDPFRAVFRFALLPVMLLTLALSTALLYATPVDSAKPLSGQFEGSFDKLEVGTLGGWAWDKAQPNTPIKVEIYDGSTLLSSALAQGFREDLKNAGKGDGNHAFNYALPANLRDGQSHVIAIRYAGTSLDLPGSPKTLTFPKS